PTHSHLQAIEHRGPPRTHANTPPLEPAGCHWPAAHAPAPPPATRPPPPFHSSRRSHPAPRVAAADRTFPAAAPTQANSSPGPTPALAPRFARPKPPAPSSAATYVRCRAIPSKNSAPALAAAAPHRRLEPMSRETPLRTPGPTTAAESPPLSTQIRPPTSASLRVAAARELKVAAALRVHPVSAPSLRTQPLPRFALHRPSARSADSLAAAHGPVPPARVSLPGAAPAPALRATAAAAVVKALDPGYARLHRSASRTAGPTAAPPSSAAPASRAARHTGIHADPASIHSGERPSRDA